jgi:hypothetical protein
MLLKNYYLDSGSAFDDPRIKRKDGISLGRETDHKISTVT